MNVTGTNTAVITSVIAITAPAISTSTRCTASNGVKSVPCIFACTASTTTIGSSTTIPIASTSANSVIRLMLTPHICIRKNAPTRDTGTASVGISVLRQSPRNTNTTSATRMKASTSVCSTFSIDASRNSDTS